jgi:hypothetical protein
VEECVKRSAGAGARAVDIRDYGRIDFSLRRGDNTSLSTMRCQFRLYRGTRFCVCSRSDRGERRRSLYRRFCSALARVISLNERWAAVLPSPIIVIDAPISESHAPYTVIGSLNSKFRALLSDSGAPHSENRERISECRLPNSDMDVACWDCRAPMSAGGVRL